MSIRNNHWYNLNTSRAYPLDDTATLLSDAGTMLPATILADLRVRWPKNFGRYAYISAITVTSGIVTVMLEAAHTLDNDPADATLIAVISVPRSELIQNRTYPLQAFQPGVGGHVAFGSVTDVSYTGLFSSPRQSLLTPRAARFYRAPPIPTVRLEGSATRLTGLVNITTTAPLQIVKETRVIAGIEYDNVAVVRLTQDTDNIDSNTPASSVFSRYLGPCGARVNSGSCQDPQPIITINDVSPNCDGVLILNFSGCATVGHVVPDCGVVLDCDRGLSTTCGSLYLPDLDGVLPSEAEPVFIPVPPDPEPPIYSDVSISEYVTTSLSLPYCDSFDSGEAAGFFVVGESMFGFIADDSPAEDFCCSGPPTSDADCCSQSTSGSQSFSGDAVFQVDSSYGTVAAAAQSVKNLALFTADLQTLYRRYTTDVKIYSDQAGSRKNAGIIANYRYNADSGLYEYWTAYLNLTAGTFGLYFFNGVTLVPLGPVATVTNLRSGDWYRLTLALSPDATIRTKVNITATLDGIYDPSISVTLTSSINAGLYMPDSGTSGLLADRSKTIFSFWRIDEVE